MSFVVRSYILFLFEELIDILLSFVFPKPISVIAIIQLYELVEWVIRTQIGAKELIWVKCLTD
ncbi:MAG: hypothetical protein ACFIN2_01030 [Candidatus Walczuchella monophlebidarum]